MGNNIYDGEIKITRWNKVIKINDEGDTITLNIGDCTLARRFINLLNLIQDTIDEVSKADDKYSDEELAKKLEFIDTKQTFISNKIDEFFGANTCLKIFNTNTPYIDDTLDFMFQVSGLIETFTGEKVDNIDKIKSKYIDKQKSRKKV